MPKTRQRIQNKTKGTANGIGAKRSGRLLTRARKRLWLSGLGGTAAEPSSPRVSVTRWEKESSPVIHSRTALQLLPSIRRRNYYITDVVVAASSAAAFNAATTTSNQPTFRSGTDARSAGRISFMEVGSDVGQCGHIVPVPVAYTAVSCGSRERKSSSGSSGADAGSRTVTGDGLVFGGSGGVRSPSGAPSPSIYRRPTLCVS